MAPPNFDAIKLALRNQALPALPATRAWENDTFDPVPGVEYVAESLVTSPGTLIGMTLQGVVESTGLYVLTWCAVAGRGTVDVSARLDALLARFAPGSAVVTTQGVAVRIRGTPCPWRTQIQTTAPWAVSVVRIPYLVRTQIP